MDRRAWFGRDGATAAPADSVAVGDWEGRVGVGEVADSLAAPISFLTPRHADAAPCVLRVRTARRRPTASS